MDTAVALWFLSRPMNKDRDKHSDKNSGSSVDPEPDEAVPDPGGGQEPQAAP